jgi:hypothetical protein
VEHWQTHSSGQRVPRQFGDVGADAADD